MTTTTIPDSHKDLLEKPLVASLATLMPDGLIQVNPVWVDYDGTYVRFNSAAGRQKDKNLKNRGVVTVMIVDTAEPYRWIEVRGHVAEITNEGADAHIDSLAKKYLGVDSYPFRNPAETRVTYKIKPEQVTPFTMG